MDGQREIDSSERNRPEDLKRRNEDEDAGGI